MLHQLPRHEDPRAPRGRPEVGQVPLRVGLRDPEARVDLRPDRVPQFAFRHGAVGPPGDEERHAVPRYARRVGFSQEEREDFIGRAVPGYVGNRHGDAIPPVDQARQREGADGTGHPAGEVAIQGGKVAGRLRREEVHPREESGRERQRIAPIPQGDRGFLPARWVFPPADHRVPPRPGAVMSGERDTRTG